MHRLKFRSAGGLLTFVVGASSGVYLKTRGHTTEGTTAAPGRPFSFTRHLCDASESRPTGGRVE